MTSSKIVRARIVPTIKPALFNKPEVWVTYDNGAEENLFSFYPDELTFVAEEFIGLTRHHALELFRSKDVAFLRS